MDFMKEATGKSTFQLLHLSDVKKTVTIFLIYYHRNPQFVIDAFKCLLSENGRGDCPLALIVETISAEFLGVLAYFEKNLILQDSEKVLKRDALLSLGEIIRFMGPKHISQFRFKIVSLLRTAIDGREPEFRSISAHVWDIFIRNIDVQCLGPLLSTIIVSMEPLLVDHPKEVNSIFRYLIISNGSLLSNYLEDLFFIESLDIVDEDIKQFVCKQKVTSKMRDEQKFERLFESYSDQINHDNLAVRIYGIKYLTELFMANRPKINRLIMGQPIIDSDIERALKLLMVACKNDDEQLRMVAGKCLGELGAVEPSYMRQNYAPQKKFTISILSVEFAIMALAELCHAYQFQKDSKQVDNFSLAIQELLQMHNVNPITETNLEIWKAIPERMRQLMEPLLTSCYTSIVVKNYLDCHPIFLSDSWSSCEEWVYVWASNIIDCIDNVKVKKLLINFKPSLKNDKNIMAILMPFVILHGLQYCSTDRRLKIKEEFDLVFSHAEQQELLSSNAQREKPKIIPALGYVVNQQPFIEKLNVSDLKVKCAKMAFNLLDFIGNWIRHCRSDPNLPLMSDYNIVKDFYESFDKKRLAVANFKCGDYARALQFIEEYIVANPAKLQSELSFLGQIYGELLDSDSLKGAMGLKTSNLKLSEQILLNNVTGRLNESAACYERMIQEQQDISVSDLKDIMQCYLNLDQPETALLICDSLIDRLYEKHVKNIPIEASAEPLWRLGRFEEIDNMTKSSVCDLNPTWGIRCGRILSCFRRNEVDEFNAESQKTRECVLREMQMSIGENSYQKGYTHVIKLHLVTEIEKTYNIFRETQKRNFDIAYKQLLVHFSEMAERLSLFQNRKNVEQILCLRRILLKELKGLFQNHCADKNMVKRLSDVIDMELGKYWLMSSKLARKSGAVSQANLYMLNCETYQMKDLFLEKAKLMWFKGDQTNAMQTLNRGIDGLLRACTVKTLPLEDKKIYAKAKFLLAIYNAQSMNIQTDLNIQFFKESQLACKESELNLVHYAQFLDKMCASLPEGRKAERFELLKEVMNNYGHSMMYGFKFIYQSMPRMLSIWLDYTVDKHGDTKSAAELTRLASIFSEQLPPFMYFTAFSQLVSRICHPNQDVYNVLKTILVKLILAFPQQCLWMILCVLKSSYASREKRCAMVLGDQRLNVATFPKLISDFNALAVRLIDLTKAGIKKGVTTTTVSALTPDLPRIISDSSFSKIIIPCQRFMQPIMPSSLDKDKPVNSHAPFPNQMAYIEGVAEEVRVLQSLQKPRRINFLASDGSSYNFLLKPRDDLRRDFRLMEFNGVVKHYLGQDLEARERRLDIRTYSVLPLNEEYGIIEWLDNLQTFRLILAQLYRQKKMGISNAELQAYYAEGTLAQQKAKDRHMQVSKKFPPVFDEWFKMNFTTAYNWYLARSAYVRTCAVMSIVGKYSG